MRARTLLAATVLLRDGAALHDNLELGPVSHDRGGGVEANRNGLKCASAAGSQARCRCPEDPHILLLARPGPFSQDEGPNRRGRVPRSIERPT